MILSPRFEQAFQYASIIHAGQLRKGTDVPYLSHLMAVSSLVLEHDGDEDEAIAALLHDAVEDAGGRKRYNDIYERFGERIAEIVSECTQRDRTEYIANIPLMSASARLVSVSDKLHNSRAILRDFRSLGDEVWNRFSHSKRWTLSYYRSLTDAFMRIDDARCNPITAELHRVVTAIEELDAQMRTNNQMPDHQHTLERFVDAQNKSHEGYATALAELRAGRKQSHWIWYILPQKRPDRADVSDQTNYYGISDRAEAMSYLHHPVLGPRLAEITAVVHTQLFDKGVHPEVLMMGEVDVKKLRSCLKLFLRVGADIDTSAFPWLETFMALARAIFRLIDKPQYRHQ